MMRSMRKIRGHLGPRPGILLLVLATLLGGVAPRVQSAPRPANTWLERRAPGAFGAESSPVPGSTVVHYRVDAQVLLPLLITSLPIAKREGVGVASFSVREYTGGSGQPMRALEFFATSFPERARGLNRLGFLREAVEMSPDGARWTAYMGVISGNREETREAAEKASDVEGESQPYSVIDGMVLPDGAENSVVRLMMAGRWRTAAELADDVDASLAHTPPAYERTIGRSESGYTEPVAFLGGLQASLAKVAAAVARGEDPRGLEQSYVHNNKVFRFRLTDIDNDSKSGKTYAASGWATSADAVVRLRYKVVDARGDTEEEFKVWVEFPGAHEPGHGGAILPFAFELQPRSFLRLRAVRVDVDDIAPTAR